MRNYHIENSWCRYFTIRERTVQMRTQAERISNKISNCLIVLEVSGMDSSSKNEPIITFQVVKQHSVKEISIPRHKPVTVIRKAVHITDSGSKEKAIMGSLITTLNLLGIFLYW